jgi:hypothetical protein
MQDLTDAKNRVFNQISRYLPVVLAAISILVTTGIANAACFTKSTIPNLRPAAVAKAQSIQEFPAESKAQDDPGDTTPSIVGFWHVTYMLDGEVFFVALDQWHSDGTEFENSYSTPVEGNICMGVWKKTGLRTVQLTHIGWNFDVAGNPAGYFILTETETLGSKGDSYSGSFVYNIYDDSGKLTQTLTGTQTATRINP